MIQILVERRGVRSRWHGREEGGRRGDDDEEETVSPAWVEGEYRDEHMEIEDHGIAASRASTAPNGSSKGRERIRDEEEREKERGSCS